MAKFCLKKNSKRQPARLRYKIEKKVREHNRKLRKEAKKTAKVKKHKSVQIPNICPFKEDILKEVEALKKQKDEEKQKLREAAKLERKKKNEAGQSLESLVKNAQIRGKLHETLSPGISNNRKISKEENSLKAYYKEFKKVIEAADVILEVIDARDPQGTRCLQVEQAVMQAQGNKRLVLVLNKADLIPRDVLDKWLKFLRKTTPAIAFKASTQNQSQKLGQRKFLNAKSKSDKLMQNSTSVGADLLMSLLANYCRNKGVKTSIRVGVVGLPNVGKSSLINSLKRSKACNVGATPGVTKLVQEVQLDSKIKLLDSPGIVFSSGSDASSCLRNVVRVSALSDPITPANAILQRVSKQQMMELYDISDYQTPQEFYSLKAARMGRFKKRGVPDATAAARSLLEDWNHGKIKYYTIPPEENHSDVHISSAIVSEIAKEFDLDNFESMETETLNKISQDAPVADDKLVIDNLEPVVSINEMEEDSNMQPGDEKLLNSNINVETKKKKNKKEKSEARVKKADPEMQLDGNQKLNKIKKAEFKKQKKMERRKEKVALQLAAGLESFSLTGEQKSDDSYDFSSDFNMK